MSESDRDQVKADFWAIFDLPDHIAPGDAAVAEARRRADAFAATWQAKYPRAVACVTDDLASLTTFLRFPREHWRRIRHTNLISSAPSANHAAGQGHRPATRRTVLPEPGVGASRGWRGVDMNPANVRLLQQLRADLFRPHQPTPEEMTDLPDTVPAVA